MFLFIYVKFSKFLITQKEKIHAMEMGERSCMA
jgi:hypothetical protein